MMHGNILRYFRGKKRRFSPHKKAASDTNKQSPKERERERKRDAEVGCLLLGVFIVAFSGE
jgi:hypothetical protein